MVAVPVPVYPVAERFVNIAREITYGTPPTTGFVTIPVAGFDPDPKQQMLEDKGLRGSMTEVYDYQSGPYWTDTTIPASPLFGDTIGHILYNLFGDYTVTGTAGTPTWTTSSAITAGATSIAVSSGSSAVGGTFIQVGSGTTSEVLTVGTGSTGTSITLAAATPARFSHLSGITITTVTAPFTHVFSTLNQASSTGSVSGQPPSHTLVDRNQTAGSTYYADLYPYACFSQVKLTGASTGLLTWEGTCSSWGQTAPTATAQVTSSISSVRSIPAWKGTSTVGGTSVYDIESWGITLNRALEPVPTIDGQQSPYVIARGVLTGTFDAMYSPALDQSALTNYLNNTQPTLVWTTSNGLSGSSLVSFSVAAQLMGFNSAKLTASKTLFGYTTAGMLIGNSTNSNNSGGYGIANITLQNAISSY